MKKCKHVWGYDVSDGSPAKFKECFKCEKRVKVKGMED